MFRRKAIRKLHRRAVFFAIKIAPFGRQRLPRQICRRQRAQLFVHRVAHRMRE